MDAKYPLALPKGSVLAGQYIIDSVLGQGGFGITYVAEDRKNNCKVAIKEFFPDTLATRVQTTVVPHAGEREESYAYGKTTFLQEAETLAEFIGNKNIVNIHTYFEENGTAYFVMDYIEGVSFDVYIKNHGGRVDYQTAENVLLPVIEALAIVHSKGIVHRDVTPDNIFITKDGTVKLLDFGAARYSLGDKSRSLDVVLKHGFAPKEQYTRHGKQGPYTDIYSLGASFYFAITGRRPSDSIDRIEEDDLIPPSALGVQITPAKEAALLKALGVQPSDRFQSMDEFKNALMSAPVPNSMPVMNSGVGVTVGTASPGGNNGIMPSGGYSPAGYGTTGGQMQAPYQTVGVTGGQATQNKEKNNKVPIIIACTAAIVAVAVLVIVLVLNGGKDDKDSTTTEVTTTEATTTEATTTEATTTEAASTEEPTTEVTLEDAPYVGYFSDLTLNNIANGGYVCETGDYSYYVENDPDSGLTRLVARKYGSDEIVVDEGAIFGLCFDNDYVYYIKDTDLWQVSIGGTDAKVGAASGDDKDVIKCYANDTCLCLIFKDVASGKFYLNCALYDGTANNKEVEINNDSAFAIADDYGYYVDSTGYKLCRQPIGCFDGSREEVVYTAPLVMSCLTSYEGDIYFTSINGAGKYEIGRYNVSTASTDGVSITFDDSAYSGSTLAVYSGELYYIANDWSGYRSTISKIDVDALDDYTGKQITNIYASDNICYWSISHDYAGYTYISGIDRDGNLTYTKLSDY